MSGQVKSARFTPEWAARIDLMAALDVEFPDGVTSVLQDGVELLWYKYGKLAEIMAGAKAQARADASSRPARQTADEFIARVPAGTYETGSAQEDDTDV